MDLPEYSLSEYLNILKSDARADPMVVNKLAWQFLKGLSSLHDGLGWQHGNMTVCKYKRNKEIPMGYSRQREINNY